jgi:L-glyceraldehyde 3-phosphate reductase
VDVYLVHAPDPRVPIPETMGAMEALYHEGKIRSIGVSNFSVEELEAANAALSGTQLVVNQVRYSLFDREEGDEILDYCQQHQIVIEAYTPLARGLLAGRYLEHETPSAEVRRYSSRLFERDRFQQLRSRARRLQDLADEAKVPMASIALHWLARRSVAPLFGASRPEQVDAVWEAWNAVPSDRVLDRADEIARGTGD